MTPGGAARQPNYHRVDWLRGHHHARFKKRVKETNDSRPCQSCRGKGGETDTVIEYGNGPWEECGWCEGTGLVTKWISGVWLRMMKQEKADRLDAALEWWILNPKGGG